MRKNIKLISIIFFLITLFNANIYSQSRVEILQEKLFTHIEKNGNDSIALSLIKQIYLETIEIDPSMAQQFAAMGQQIAIELNDSIGLGVMYGYSGNALLAKKTYFMAMEAHYSAYEIFTKFNDQKNLANSLLNIGRTYLAQEIYSISEDKIDKAKIIFDELNYSKGKANALKYLGLANISLDEHLALEYFEQALEILDDKKDELIIAEIKIYIAQANLQLLELDVAIRFVNEALTIFETTESEIKIANANFLFGEIYLENDNIDKAKKKFKEALSVFEKLNSLEKISKTYQKLAEIYFIEGQFIKSIDYANKGLINAMDFNYLPIRRDIYFVLSNSYSELKNYKKAFSNQKQYAQMIDSINENKKQSQFSGFQMDLETQNKEKEIDLLKIQSEKDKLMSAKKQYKRNTIFVTVLALMILAFIVVLIIRFREKNKSNKLLQDSNKQLKTEIEDRKLAQIELQNSEERYRLVFRKTPIGIMQFDADLKITDANDKFSEIFNISIDQMVGTELNTIFDRNSVVGFNLALTNKEAKIIKNDTEIITKGQVIYISLTIKPYSYNTERGKIKGGVVIIEDLTEQKKAEKFYNKNILKKQNLLNLYPGNLLHIKKKGDIISAHIPDSPDTEHNIRHINELIPESSSNKLFNEIDVALNEKTERKFIYKDSVAGTENIVKIIPDSNNSLLIILSEFYTLSQDKRKLESTVIEDVIKTDRKVIPKKEQYYIEIYKDIEKDLFPVYQNIQKQLSFIVLRGFAEKINSIGEKYNNRQLQDYGNKLLENIVTFNVLKVNSILSKFPSLISEYINQTPAYK